MYINDYGENGKLSGENYGFAKWMLEIDGMIGISKAKLENGLVEITEGPLLHMKDMIVKYSKRNRNCFVSICVAGIKIET